VTTRSGDELVGAEPVSRPARAVVWALAVVLLLGLGLDRWQVQRERAALLEAVTAGERLVDRSSAGLRGLRA
jgi:hypothetical protein